MSDSLQIANGAVKFAVGNAGAATIPAFSNTTVSLMSGSVTYVTDCPARVTASQMRVTSTGTNNSYAVTMVAIL